MGGRRARSRQLPLARAGSTAAVAEEPRESGEVVEVTRSGAPVAVIGPPRARVISAERFRALIASAPRPDEAFADELAAARAGVGPPGEPWPS